MYMFGFRAQDGDNTLAPPLLSENPGVAIPYLVLVLVATVVGFIGNVLIIGAFFVSKRVRIVGNEFVLNLALADLVITVFADPFLILGVTAGEAWFVARPGLCEFVASVCLGACICAFLTLTAVTISRYIYVCYGEHYSLLITRSRIVALCILCWLSAFLLESANFFGWGGHKFDRKHNSCMWDRTKHLSYTLFLAVGLIGLPISIMITAYTLIFMKIRKMKRRVALAMVESGKKGNSVYVNQPPKPTTTNSNPRDTNTSNNKDTNIATTDNKSIQVISWGRAFSREWWEVVKSTRTFFLILVAFVITWGPYAIVNAADVHDTFSLELHLYVSAWAHLHSAANCIIYAATNVHFRLAFSRVLCLTQAHAQVNPSNGLELANSVSGIAYQRCEDYGKGKVCVSDDNFSGGGGRGSGRGDGGDKCIVIGSAGNIGNAAVPGLSGAQDCVVDRVNTSKNGSYCTGRCSNEDGLGEGNSGGDTKGMEDANYGDDPVDHIGKDGGSVQEGGGLRVYSDTSNPGRVRRVSVVGFKEAEAQWIMQNGQGLQQHKSPQLSTDESHSA